MNPESILTQILTYVNIILFKTPSFKNDDEYEVKCC